jgi:hypothetical protein
MVWLFTRDRDSLTLETRFQNDTREYILVIRHPDGDQRTERFDDAETFRLRLVAIETDLEADRWKQLGPPIFLRDGWRVS